MMKKVSKKILALILTLIMVVGIVPMGTLSVTAASEQWLWPVPGGWLTQSWGKTKFSDNHKGIDIGGGNKPIVATKSGTVITVYDGCNNWNSLCTGGKTCKKLGKCNPTKNGKANEKGYWNGCCNQGYGRGVIVKNNDGTIASYGHMSAVYVKYNSKVVQGQILGTVGSRGYSKGAHLHFQLKDKSDNVINNNPMNKGYKTGVTYYDEPINFVISNKGSTETFNMAATITASLNQNAPVQKWAYYISKNEKEVKKIDGVNNPTKNHVDTKTMDYQRTSPDSWDSTPTLTSSYRYTITKFLGKNLTPNTTYYFKVIAKIGGVWYQSGVKSFKTTNKAPTASIPKINGSADIGINDSASVSWTNSGANAYDSYTYAVKVYDSDGMMIHSKSGITGTCYAIPSSCFSKAGQYSVELITSNNVSSVTSDTRAYFNVHDDVFVTFYDSVDKNNIESEPQRVTYGHAAIAPADPVKTGYTFKKWDKSFDKVTSDITINTVFEPNKYQVNFIDGMTHQQLKSENISFNTVLSDSDYPVVPSHKGYTFVGWSESNYKVLAEEHTLYARYKWDSPYTTQTEIVSVERAKSDTSSTNNDGYSVKVKVSAPSIDNGGTSSTIKGRAVVALKTSAGRLLAETESSAFVLYPKQSSIATKEVEVFVPYEALEDDLAEVTEAYVVNNYNSAGAISTVAKDTEKTISSNSNEWKYSDTIQTVGTNNVVDVDSTKDYYTYKLETTTTTDSLLTSMSGWDLISTRWSPVVESGSVEYVPTWPLLGNTSATASKKNQVSGSRFNNNTTSGKYIYNRYNNYSKIKKSSETDTTKIVANDKLYQYIYYHWCRNLNNGTLSHHVSGYKLYADTTSGNKYYTFHAFTKMVADSDANYPYVYDSTHDHSYYKRDTSKMTAQPYRDSCKDSYYWPTRLNAYLNSWTLQRKIYTYSSSSLSDTITVNSSSQIPDNSSSTSTKVDSNVTLSTTVDKTVSDVQRWYAYKTLNPVSNIDKNQYTIDVNVGIENAGKKVTVYVYKYADVADYTTEYVDSAQIDENGRLYIENAQMREACTVDTGDFTIAVSYAGETNAVVVGKIEAEKRTVNVKYLDFDGKTIFETNIACGSNVESPNSDLLTIPEGYEFGGWDVSTIEVNGDITVKPIKNQKKVVVTFVDWENQEVKTIDDVPYGSDIERYLPEITPVDGKTVSWDLSNCETELQETTFTNEETGEEETVENSVLVVKDNMVITTVSEVLNNTYEFITPDSKIIEDLKTESNDVDDSLDKITEDDIASIISVENGEIIETPETVEEDEEIIFLGWRNARTGEYLENNIAQVGSESNEVLIYYPEFEYAETTEEPEADVESGEYSEAKNVTLTTSTENAVVYYTTDGTDPSVSNTAKAVEYDDETNLPLPITINRSCVLKFYAVSFGRNDSSVVTVLYAINNSTSGARYHILNINATTDDDYVYSTLIREGSSVDITSLDSFEGYNYEGVYYDEEFNEEFDIEDAVVETLDLYAKYTADVYTVVFKDYDDSVLNTQEVEYGNCPKYPASPTREGYHFVGWDNDCSEITENTELVAMYVSNDEYATVSLNAHRKSRMEGTSYQLKASITPSDLEDEILYWYSSDCSVATVDDNGYVTFVSPGTAIITVEVVSTGETDACNITVVSDTNNTIAVNPGADIGIFGGYLVGVLPEQNTVSEIKSKLSNLPEMLKVVNGDVELGEEDIVPTGSVIELYNEDGNKADSIKVVVTGDVNCDGLVNNRDAAWTTQYLVNKVSVNDESQILSLDVNGDGYVNNRDAAMISRYLVGKETF